MTDQPYFHTKVPTLFQPSEHRILTNGLEAMTQSCEASKKIIELLEGQMAAVQLRCDELIARNAQLESRDYINKGEVE